MSIVPGVTLAAYLLFKKGIGVESVEEDLAFSPIPG
jgi:hypothetical protein